MSSFHMLPNLPTNIDQRKLVDLFTDLMLRDTCLRCSLIDVFSASKENASKRIFLGVRSYGLTHSHHGISATPVI